MRTIIIALVVGLALAGAVAPTASAEEVSPPTTPDSFPPECWMTLKEYDLIIVVLRLPDEIYCRL